jgi:hypothetical protein
MNAADVIRIYEGSNGDATKVLYAELESLGPQGVIAMNLFRACKCSERAKVYRGRGYRDEAYRRKQWSMENLCAALTAQCAENWGWGIDEKARAEGSPHHHVLYIDTSAGQISFHTDHRGAGPDFPGTWDGVKNASAGRACSLVAGIFRLAETAAPIPSMTCGSAVA